jgi:hypothetical protein
VRVLSGRAPAPAFQERHPTELAKINGTREQLEGKLQSHYGYAKDKAKAEIDAWCSRM